MKIKKYQVITFMLAVYALFMTLYFGLDLLKTGESWRFWITLSAEIIVIVLTFFSLRKKEMYRQKRKQEEQDLSDE